MKTTNESNAMNQHHEPQAQSAGSRAKVNTAGPDDVDPLAELLKARD